MLGARPRVPHTQYAHTQLYYDPRPARTPLPRRAVHAKMHPELISLSHPIPHTSHESESHARAAQPATRSGPCPSPLPFSLPCPALLPDMTTPKVPPQPSVNYRGTRQRHRRRRAFHRASHPLHLHTRTENRRSSGGATSPHRTAFAHPSPATDTPTPVGGLVSAETPRA